MFTTKLDSLFELIEKKMHISIRSAAKELGIPATSVTKIARYLEQLGFVSINYKSVVGPEIVHLKSPQPEFGGIDETELINKLKYYKSFNDVASANKLLYDLYRYLLEKDDEETKEIYVKVLKFHRATFSNTFVGAKTQESIQKLESYKIHADRLVMDVEIIKQLLQPVPFYLVALLKISDITAMIIECIKQEVINSITFNVVFKTHKEEGVVREEYKKKILGIMKEVFPDLPEERLHVFSDYVILTSLGMGEVEFLLRDPQLEEIVINNAFEPIWVYHKKYGWLETNIIVDDESKIIHYATLAGRNADKTITTLAPLMDSNLKTGDRVNATLKPISSKGNTVTIRKFAESPWSITDFILNNTIDYYTSALVWTAMQYELSILIVGGTGSGKTSTLNVFCIFIPPNQRVISIEDTRELQLPRTLHWVPLATRLPNPEGKGAVTMLDLIVNSLRMRPDRILVGEIRRKKEAEVLFEAMHTGHSVYATLHANTVAEAITRLTSEPIGIPKSLLSAIDMIFVQNRNRRTNTRRTFQVAEMVNDGNFNLLMQYDFKKDKLVKLRAASELYTRLQVFSGLTRAEVDSEIREKIRILKYLTDKNIRNNEQIAQIIDYYYINKKFLFKSLFGDKNR